MYTITLLYIMSLHCYTRCPSLTCLGNLMVDNLVAWWDERLVEKLVDMSVRQMVVVMVNVTVSVLA